MQSKNVWFWFPIIKCHMLYLKLWIVYVLRVSVSVERGLHQLKEVSLKATAIKLIKSCVFWLFGVNTYILRLLGKSASHHLVETCSSLDRLFSWERRLADVFQSSSSLFLSLQEAAEKFWWCNKHFQLRFIADNEAFSLVWFCHLFLSSDVVSSLLSF